MSDSPYILVGEDENTESSETFVSANEFGGRYHPGSTQDNKLIHFCNENNMEFSVYKMIVFEPEFNDYYSNTGRIFKRKTYQITGIKFKNSDDALLFRLRWANG